MNEYYDIVLLNNLNKVKNKFYKLRNLFLIKLIIKKYQYGKNFNSSLSNELKLEGFGSVNK